LSQFHGMGPKALSLLHEASLKNLSFKSE
jgi:hypothetical protein